MKYIFKSNIFWLTLLIILHIYLLMQLVFFPYPELFVYSHLTQHGLIPYKEIFDQHFPGLMFFPINLSSLGFTDLTSMRILHFVLTILSDVFIYIAAKFVFKRKFTPLAILMFYIIWQIYYEGHVLWIESFVTPMLLLSFILLLKYIQNTKYHYLIVSSLLLSIATIFKQTTLPLAILFLMFTLIKLKNFKKVLILSLIYATPLVLMLIYFASLNALRDLIYWTYTFNISIFSQMGRTHPKLLDLFRLLPVFGICAWFSLFSLFKKANSTFVITFIFFIGSLFYSYARFDLVHLQPALPFAVLIIFQAVDKIKINNKIIAVALTLYSLYSYRIFKANFNFYNRPGLVPMFNDTETLEIKRFFSSIPEDFTVFGLGTYPHIYYLLDKIPPGNVFVFQFPWFMKIAESKILKGVEDFPPDYVIRNESATVGGYKLIEYMQNINSYVDSNYLLVTRIGDNEILKKL